MNQEDEDEVVLAQELRQQLGEDRSGLADRIIFGQDVEEFIERNPIGGYLVARAQEQIDVATTIFLRAKDLSTDEIKDAHFDASVAYAIIGWLRSAIEDGHKATEQVKSDEQLDT